MSSHESAPIEPTDIAIVGMAGRFPGARDLDTFWELVVSGKNAFSRLSDEQLKAAGVSPELIHDPAYVPVAGVLEDVECFDAEFFDIGPRDAALMDPQHRHFLEVCWEALEDAAHVPSRFDGSIGIYAGSGMNGYLVNNLLPNKELVDPLGLFAVRHTSNDKDFLSTGVSYRLNLKGPSVNVQTACSTSLVALHMAAQALISGECDMALAGGVTIEVPHGTGYLYREGEVLSRDGVCRAFDAASSGTILTSGAGVVVLRRLSDALADGDHIYSVVKATAINNDGAGKVGYLAPSVDGHAAVVAESQELAGITADTIQYVEAHGTGTPVGDPIEVAALTQAFRRTTDAKGFARIGSTKPTIGHLDTAAGVASVIKTSLAIEKQILPPMANYTGENPLLDLESTPFVLSPEPAEWPRLAGPRRAGISSLGVGGTNAHAILQEPPERSTRKQGSTPAGYEILPLSAKTPAALERARARLADYLEKHPELSLQDVAFTLQEGREEFAHREAIGARTVEEAIEKLSRPHQAAKAADAPSVVLMFPGGGAQYPNMGRELYDTEPVYRQAVDLCLSLTEPALRSAIRELMFPAEGYEQSAAEQLAMPSFQLPAIFITEYALAKLWMSWGITPHAMTGHSLGEYTAACLAGVFSLGDALEIVALRGRIAERSKDAAMLTVAMPEVRVRELLPADVSLAAVNGPELCVVSGATPHISAFESVLVAQDIQTRRVRIHGAGHCHLLDPHLGELRRALSKIRLNEPSIPYVSNVTGDWIRAQDATDPDYWVRHLRYTVRFADGLATLLEDPNRILIEVGPGNMLTALARQQPTRAVLALPSLPHPTETTPATEVAYAALCRVWSAGVHLQWKDLRGGFDWNRISLPAYAFERTSHWFTPAATPTTTKVLDPERWAFRPSWRRSDLVGPVPVLSEMETWLIVGSGKRCQRLATELRRRGADAVTVSLERHFVRHSAWRYGGRLADRGDWDFITNELSNFRQKVSGVIWAAQLGNSNSDDASFFGPVVLMQSLTGAGHRPTSLTLLTAGSYSVDGEPAPNMLGSLSEGIARVAPVEFESLKARVMDTGDKLLDRDCDAVVDEALLGDETVVALRGGRRWVRSSEPLSLPPAHANRNWFGKSVMITGGLGGVGLSLARHFATTEPGIRLTLVSRTALPPRELWGSLLDRSNAVARAIRAVVELESLGAEVLTYSADVADPGDLGATFAAALQRFRSIDTVVHAAGVFDDAPILTRGRPDMAAVLRPKVAGTEALLRLARIQRVKTVVLCSSVSAEVGLPGQVDYAAANAYLNAVAAAPQQGGTRVVSVPFGRWDEVGMAAPQTAVSDGLPFVGRRTNAGGSNRFRSAKLPNDLWVLNEHRLQSGTPLMPGTGFLQLFATVAREVVGQKAIAFEGVEFSEALVARDGAATIFVTELAGSSLTVRSRQTIHASATVLQAAPAPVSGATFDWTRQVLDKAAIPTVQDSRLVFGPRWNVLRSLDRDGERTLASIALPEQFISDLDEYDLHPALLDIALSCGVPTEFLSPGSVVAPVRCDLFEVFSPLPSRLRVVAEGIDSSDDAEMRFNVTVLDETGGQVVVQALGMTYRRLPAESVSRITSQVKPVRPLVPFGSGLNPVQTWPLFDRAMTSNLPVVGLTSLSVQDLRYLAENERSAVTGGALLARPSLGTDLEAPRSEAEAVLARIWTECLGIDGLGINDDFFELGGHSLIGLRLISRVQSEFGVKFVLATIQERPTISLQAQLLQASGAESAPVEAPTITSDSWSSLVVLRAQGDKAPFFCVHGMFGNVMNFTDLANAMPADRPFIAIQQHGLDGTPSPYRTVESMAAAYIEDVRRCQPEGPYLLGGYSAGGCIALEMARQLAESGEQVSRVVLLDSWGPAMMSLEARPRFIRMMRRLRFEGPKLLSRKVRYTWSRMRPAKTGPIVFRNAPAEQTVFVNPELGSVVVDALRQYKFGSVEVPVTLVTAELREPETRFLPRDLGWGRLFPRLDIRAVQAPHITMCTGTNAPKVAQAIADALDS